MHKNGNSLRPAYLTSLLHVIAAPLTSRYESGKKATRNFFSTKNPWKLQMAGKPAKSVCRLIASRK
jgi:hypothetical protein